MKVVVIGGTGLIGSKLVAMLGEHGYEAVPAAPNTGVNTLTGEGLAEVLEDAAVVVDVSNSPSFADDRHGVLPSLDHQSARIILEGRGRALRRAVGGRYGPAFGVGILPGEDCPGKADP